MSGRDSWTIAPTLAWFGAFAAAGLLVIDGNVDALADRVIAHADQPAPPRAAPFAPAPVQVAQADADSDDSSAATGGGSGSGDPASGAGAASRAKLGALEDTCLDGTIDGPRTLAGSAAEGRRGSIDGPRTLAGSAAEGRRGSIDHCARWAMDGYYKAVADSRAGTLGRPVRVSWYGDSVVASDELPGRLRKKLQADLGDGGPGFVFAAPPHRFCQHQAISLDDRGSWEPHAISTRPAADGQYGPGGSSVDTDDGRASIKILHGTATNAELYYLASTHGGKVSLRADGTTVVTADTRGDHTFAGYTTAAVSGGATTFVIETAGSVRLFGLDLENTRGAVVDNFGIVSVHVKSFANHDQAAWTAQLAHRDADLIMIMIGANEAQWLGPNDQDTRDYASHYAKILEPIRAARPDGSCLVVSPTDQAEAKDGGYPSRPVMPLLVAAQRQAAHAAGCAFFSTYDWMGGKGSAAKWFAHGLVGSDFQHLTQVGANKLGDAVYDALTTGASRFASKS